MKNFVPLPYRRVAVRRATFPLTEPAARRNLLGREAYRRTEFIVLREGPRCAIARVEKEAPDELFSPIASVELFASADDCLWVDDPSVDVGIPSQLAAAARAAGVGPDGTLVVHGKYEHVNFIHRPEPLAIRVVDVVPPKPGKLWAMANQVLAFAPELPPIELRIEPIDLVELAHAHRASEYLFPCQASSIDVGAPVHFLDTRPELRAWTMIGCERSAEFHRHFYGCEPDRVDICPKGKTSTTGSLTLTKCCLLESAVECEGDRAVVPWGADLRHVQEALAYLAARGSDHLRPHREGE